jgi:hypothetical protein
LANASEQHYEYIAEHEEGNVVSGRVMEISSEHARVELGEGIQCTCRIAMEGPAGRDSSRIEWICR